MLLSSHIIVSGLLGSQTGNYLLAAAIGLASHYVVDAIPHWDYYISPDFDSKAETDGWRFLMGGFFLKELTKILADILIGLILVFIFLKYLKNVNPISVFTSIFFGILPDPLQLLYLITNWRALKPNNDIQLKLHTLIYKKKPTILVGIFTQIATIILIFLVLRF